MVLYGVPSVYQLTGKSKTLIHANQRKEKIRLDQISHDITVLDLAICFIKFFRFVYIRYKDRKATAPK